MINLYKNFIKKIFNFIIKILDKPNEKKIFNFFKNKLSENTIIIDVGAHKGESIKFYSDNFKIKKIHSFEPNKKIFEIIKKKNLIIRKFLI